MVVLGRPATQFDAMKDIIIIGALYRFLRDENWQVDYLFCDSWQRARAVHNWESTPDHFTGYLCCWTPLRPELIDVIMMWSAVQSWWTVASWRSRPRGQLLGLLLVSWWVSRIWDAGHQEVSSLVDTWTCWALKRFSMLQAEGKIQDNEWLDSLRVYCVNCKTSKKN